MVAELRDNVAAVGAGPTSARSSRKSSSATALPHWHARALKNLEVSSASLQRGVPAANALRNFAAVLSDRPPTGEYFELSVPVDVAVDVFISHNWSSPRWRKFFVLAFHFNLHRTLIISIFVAAVACAMMHFGIFPIGIASNVFVYDGKPYSRGFLAFPLGVATFLVCLLFAHELDNLPCSPFKRKMLWLDRTCVHQTEPDKKKEGILCLAAFLARSQDILICYSDVYMSKLWTVYEVATWLMLHRGKRILMRPLLVPSVLLGGLLIFTVLEALVCVTNFSQSSTGFEILPMVGIAVPILCYYPCCTSAAWLGAKLAQERERIVDHVRKFRLSDASCANEADRHVVQQNILAFMKLADLCDPDAEDETVFRAFEELVRTDVPKLMHSSFGRVGVPYWWLTSWFFPRAVAYFDVVAGQLQDSEPWRYVLLEFLLNAVLVFAVGPLLLALVLTSTRIPRFRSAPAIAGLGAFATFLLALFLFISYDLTARGAESDFWLIAALLTFASLALTAFAAYRP